MVQAFNTFREYILNQGTHLTENREVIKQVRLVNSLSFIGIFAYGVWALSYVMDDYKITTIESVIAMIMLIFVIWCNSRGWFSFALLTQYFGSILQIVYWGVGHGAADGSEYLLVVTTAMSLMYFKNIFILGALFIFNISCFGFIQYMNTTYGPLLDNGNDLYYSNILSAFLVLFLISYYFKRENQIQEKLLLDQNKKLGIEKKKSENLLQQVNASNKDLQEKSEIITLKNHQNELLLKEIHHRVKNNLQIISSLLFLQSEEIRDQDVSDAIESSQRRVETMAMIHQKLYQRSNLAAIEMKDYLTNLGESLLDAYVDGHHDIELRIQMEPIEFNIDMAVPIGLIANELITNCLKYAFPNFRPGIIQIIFDKEVDGRYSLMIKDDGIGKTNTSHKISFGFKLVELLVKQIKGSMTSGNDDGHWVEIKFK